MIDCHVLCSLEDHIRTGTCDLNHPVLAGVENTDSWHAMKVDLQHGFPLDVLMVSSPVLAIAANGEHLSCDGFSLDETICFGSLEYIAGCIGDLSLAPRRDGLEAAILGSSHSRPPSPLRAMIGDSTEEFHRASHEEGGINVPSSTTISLLENTLTTQAMVMIPQW
jgi:hypothetical protein